MPSCFKPQTFDFLNDIAVDSHFSAFLVPNFNMFDRNCISILILNF